MGVFFWNLGGSLKMVMLITSLVLPSSCLGQAWLLAPFPVSVSSHFSLGGACWEGPQVTPSGCYAKAKGLCRFSRKCSLTTMVF